MALAPYLRGVDIMIAGGGDELLANGDDLLQPTDQAQAATARPYPVQARDAEGRTVPVVTTSGDLRYVGRLITGFDARGNLVRVAEESGPVRVVGGDHRDAVQPDRATQQTVADPVKRSVDALALNRLADTEVQLDGRRGPGVRTQETNLGNLVADAMMFAGRRVAAEEGLRPRRSRSTTAAASATTTSCRATSPPGSPNSTHSPSPRSRTSWP